MVCIICSIHLLAIPAFFYFDLKYILAWFLSHLFFGTIGASIGLHRLFSHRSFTPVPTLFNFIAVVATLCFEGGPIFWAAAHREHHRFSESFGDPHTAKRGFFWSHVGWLFYQNPNGFSYLKSLRLVGDLRKLKFIVWLELNSTKFNFTFLALLAIICTVYGHPGLFFWIGPMRIVSVWHATWMINSFAHRAKFFGERKDGISLRNSILLSLIIGGDGDHDYHHRHPNSVKHSESKIHFDHGYLIIHLWSLLGLATYRETSKRSFPQSSR